MPGDRPVRPRILLVVVTHNNAAHIEGCLATVAAREDIDLVVFDNASADDTVARIRRAAPSAQLIESASNLGFAAAVNRAAGFLDRHAYLALLNPDTVPEPDALDALLALAVKAPSAGLWGGRTVDGEGRLDPTCALALPSLWHAASWGLGLGILPWPHAFRPDSLGGWDRIGVREVPALSGAMVLIAAPLWRALGGFDERFFVYGEDVDLCIRARRLGARPMLTSAAACVHFAAASSASRTEHLVRLLAGKAALYRLHTRHGALARALLLTGVAIRAGLETAFRPGRRDWRGAWARRDDWKRGWPARP